MNFLFLRCTRIDVDEKDKPRPKNITNYRLQNHMLNGKLKNTSQVLFVNRQASRLKLTGINKEAPEVRLDMYFDKSTKDFRLMMNLLSERPGTEGLSQSFRLLTIFDKHFKRQWTPNDIRILESNVSGDNAW